MAVTSRHLVLATAAVCATIAVVYLPPELRTATSYFPSTHLRNVRSALSDAQQRLSELEWRDTALMRFADLSRHGDRLYLSPDTELSAEVVHNWEESIRGPWDRIAAENSAVSTILTLAVDTVAGGRWSGVMNYVLPNTRHGPVCGATLRLGRNNLRDVDQGRLLALGPRSSLFGPCAFYAGFGIPGPHIQQWLELSSHQLALFPDWINGNARASRRPTDISGYIESNESFQKCFFGDFDQCRAAAMWTRSGTNGDFDDILAVSTSWLRWRYADHGLGPAAGTFLSDLYVDTGRERFGQFWRSQADVETAFATAVGSSLGEWTWHWAQARYVLPRRRGPSVSWTSMLLGLLIALVVVGGSTAAASLRHVE